MLPGKNAIDCACGGLKERRARHCQFCRNIESGDHAAPRVLYTRRSSMAILTGRVYFVMLSRPLERPEEPFIP